MTCSSQLWFEVISNEMRNNSWLPYVESPAGASGGRVCAGLLASLPASVTLMSNFLFLDVFVSVVCALFPTVHGLKTLSGTQIIKFPSSLHVSCASGRQRNPSQPP